MFGKTSKVWMIVNFFVLFTSIGYSRLSQLVHGESGLSCAYVFEVNEIGESDLGLISKSSCW